MLESISWCSSLSSSSDSFWHHCLLAQHDSLANAVFSSTSDNAARTLVRASYEWLLIRRSCNIQYSTVQYSTVQYSTVQYSTVQYSTVRYGTVRYGTVRYGTVHYSTEQCSAVQCSAVRILIFKRILRCIVLRGDIIFRYAK